MTLAPLLVAFLGVLGVDERGADPNAADAAVRVPADAQAPLVGNLPRADAIAERLPLAGEAETAETKALDAPRLAPTPLRLPVLPRELLAAGSQFRLRLGTGASPELGVAPPPTTLELDRARTLFSLPLSASASWLRFRDGRRFANGVDLRLDAYSLTRVGQGARSLDAQLVLARGAAWWRAYLDDSVDRPWYAEVVADVADAAQGLHAGRHQPTTSPHRWPLRGQLALGRGRILPIGPRLRLARLERMLREAGVLDAPLPTEVGREVLRTWWALRAELGYAQRLAHTLQILAAAGLLRGEVSQDEVYAFGRIFEDPVQATRWEGFDSRLAVRYGTTWGSGETATLLGAGRATVTLRASHRHVINLSQNAAWSYEGVLSLAPRPIDRVDNLLRPIGRGTPTVDRGRIALTLPVSYQHYVYDRAYNLNKVISLQARLGMAHAVLSPTRPSSSTVHAMAGIGAELFWLRGQTSGVDAGVDCDVGYAYGRLAYVLGLRLGFALGHNAATYVAP